MGNQTALLRLSFVRWCRASVNGNPRWAFTAWTADGDLLELRTATDSGCAYACNIGWLRTGTILRVQYHETLTGNLIAHLWDDSRTAGVDLNTQFDALSEAAQLNADIGDPQTIHQQTRL